MGSLLAVRGGVATESKLFSRFKSGGVEGSSAVLLLFACDGVVLAYPARERRPGGDDRVSPTAASGLTERIGLPDCPEFRRLLARVVVAACASDLRLVTRALSAGDIGLGGGRPTCPAAARILAFSAMALGLVIGDDLGRRFCCARCPPVVLRLLRPVLCLVVNGLALAADHNARPREDLGAFVRSSLLPSTESMSKISRRGSSCARRIASGGFGGIQLSR